MWKLVYASAHVERKKRIAKDDLEDILFDSAALIDAELLALT